MRYPIEPGVAAARRVRRAGAVAALALSLVPAPAWAQAAPDAAPPAVAALGTCRLESGAEIVDCRVAYRSYGRLSPARDNVILVPTFFGGRSEDHAFMLGTYVDTARYHVVVVDALADGHSSSPSNTDPVSRRAFDRLTIGDMVESQRRLLQEHLGIPRVRAIVGISMGAFQAFEWAVGHPDFADIIVPVVGSPRPGAGDRLVYATLLGAADRARAAGMSGDEAWMQTSRVETLFMRTPEATEEKGPERIEADVMDLAASYARAGWSLEDYAAQSRALLSHDVSIAFDGDMERAARAVRARMLVVYSPDDRMVSPESSAEFARSAGVEALALPSACGHAVFWCEHEVIGAAVRDFIDRGGQVAGARRR